jgi:hypothetical protein
LRIRQTVGELGTARRERAVTANLLGKIAVAVVAEVDIAVNQSAARVLGMRLDLFGCGLHPREVELSSADRVEPLIDEVAILKVVLCCEISHRGLRPVRS